MLTFDVKTAEGQITTLALNNRITMDKVLYPFKFQFLFL